MYIRVLCTIIYQSDDLALSASDTLSLTEIRCWLPELRRRRILHSIHLDLIYLDGRYRDISPQRIAVDKARSARSSVMVDEYTSNCPRGILPLPTSRSLISTDLRRRRIPLIPVIIEGKYGTCNEPEGVEFPPVDYWVRYQR